MDKLLPDLDEGKWEVAKNEQGRRVRAGKLVAGSLSRRCPKGRGILNDSNARGSCDRAYD